MKRSAVKSPTEQSTRIGTQSCTDLGDDSACVGGPRHVSLACVWGNLEGPDTSVGPCKAGV
jgi:hypothetical protein